MALNPEGVRPQRGLTPLLLGLETSSKVFSVAVCEGDRILSSLKLEDPASRSDRLTDLIQDVLRGAKTELRRLDGFAVSIGPGSFTGLRVGAATAKTLAWALKKPVLPISSLEVLARNGVWAGSPIGLFVDARKGKVYTAAFSLDGSGKLQRLSKDELLLPEEAVYKLPPKAVLIGDGIPKYQGLLSSFPLVPPGNWIPSAENLCRIAALHWPAGVLDDPHRLVPQYLYSKESDITGW